MFRILALETSERTGSAAAAADDKLLAELQLDPGQRSAQSLAPAIAALLRQVGWQPRDVNLVAVTNGPGSFTGLRVGVATAKVLAYAVGADVLGINTLAAIAAAAPENTGAVSVAIDAQRGDVVAQRFVRCSDGWLTPDHEPRLLPIRDWVANLPTGTAVSGPGLAKWVEPLPPGLTRLDPVYWAPTAANVARMAYRDFLAGRRDDLWTLLPVYSRPSAAEEKWAKR